MASIKTKVEFRPSVKVFITKSNKFRAKIKEKRNSVPYEVTIGGNEWKKGKGRKFEEKIKYALQRILIKLAREADSISKI